MTLTIWRYEARRTGRQPLVTPLASGALAALATAVAYTSHASSRGINRDLVAVVEVALPLAAALVAIWSVLGDRALEVQLSLPRSYRTLVLGRLALASAPAGLVGALLIVVLSMLGRLPGGHGVVSGQLVWLAPALALAGVGLAVAVAVRSAAAGTAVIAVAWLLEQVKRDAFAEHAWARPLFLFTTTYQPDAPAWLTAAALVAVWLLLANPERLLKEDQ
jgi:hypothetical protein